jgi:hypothetical protein
MPMQIAEKITSQRAGNGFPSYLEVQPLSYQDTKELIDPAKRRKKEQEKERKFMGNVYSSFSKPEFLKRFGINTKPKPAEKSETSLLNLAKISIESILNSMRLENRLLREHYFSSNTSVSALYSYVEKPEELEKLHTITSNISSKTYRKFLTETEHMLSAQTRALQAMIDRYARKNSKKVFTCEEIHLNEKTINQLADYYKMDSVVKSYLLSFHQRNKENLARLINETYSELIRTKEIRN